MSEDEALIADARRYRTLKQIGTVGSGSLGGNQLKAEASFRYWCSDARLDQIVDQAAEKIAAQDQMAR